jgi:hypothetical protein
MSQLKVGSIVDASGGNTATINTYTPTESNMMGKNRIINGDMRIDQRNAGAAVTVNSATDTYAVDRFPAAASGGGAFSYQRSTTSATNFSNSLLATVTTADSSIAAGDYYGIQHKIEGFNTADFNSGTANAKTITLSFWVRSSVTGTYGVSFGNNANNRWYPSSYSISSANTWEQKSITLTCDTSGTWDTTTGIGVWIWFDLGSGSTYQGTSNAWTGSTKLTISGATQWVANSGATFYITGVQLEVGSVATPFERRPYGTELQLCQRYYFKYGNLSGANTYPIMFQCYSSTSAFGQICNLPVQMRTTPTASTSGTFTAGTAAGGVAGAFTSTLVDRPSANFLTTSGWTGSSSLVAGNVTMPDSAFVQASAEL